MLQRRENAYREMASTALEYCKLLNGSLPSSESMLILDRLYDSVSRISKKKPKMDFCTLKDPLKSSFGKTKAAGTVECALGAKLVQIVDSIPKAALLGLSGLFQLALLTIVLQQQVHNAGGKRVIGI